MKKLLLVAVGIGLGYGFASLRSGPGFEGGVFDDLGAKFREFGNTVRGSYRARQDELRDAIAGTDDDPRP